MLDFRKLKSAIDVRRSVRTFEPHCVADADRQKFDEDSAEAIELCGVVGTARIAVLDFADDNTAPGRMATYGFIKGARTYFVLLVKADADDAVCRRAAAAMELMVLDAVSVGYGTCWIGGTFSRSTFGGLASQGDDERIVAVIAVGREAKPGFAERVIRAVSGSRDKDGRPRRRDFDSMFISVDGSGTDSRVHAALCDVRMAPSSTNSQPWRATMFDGGRRVVFEAATHNSYTQTDMGIALCHFAIGLWPRRVDFDTQMTAVVDLD